jgi:hypothetical protein
VTVRHVRDRTSRPWHLWLVAIAMLVLYVGGARDYLLILMGDLDYVYRQFGSGGMAYFIGYPSSLRLIWTVTIAAGLVAPVLLLLRRRRALHVAVLAAIAQFVLLLVTFALLDRWVLLGAAVSWFDIGVGLATAVFAGYCWAAGRRAQDR